MNEICFELKESKCYCPIGFKGVDCKEPNTNIIDEKCELPESLPSVCKTALNLCGPSCPPGHICCSVGCAATCKSRDECKTTAECPGNKICLQPQSRPNVCDCPFGFEGEDCMERQDGIDVRCPYPDDLIDLCVTSQVDVHCSEGNPCPDGEICCLGANGCSINCIPIECKTTAECPGNRICFQPQSRPNFCACPLGFEGEDCMEQQDDIDVRCPYPDDLIDLCVTSQVDVQCSEGNPCPDGEICCIGANGCSTNCIPIECKTTAECPKNKICFQPQSRPNVCDCPFGFEGGDCMKRQDGIDDRCPYPDDLIDLCVASQVDPQCSEGNPCPDGEICCLGANGCSTNCVPIECKTTAECPGNKICLQPQSRPNVCDCPFGFEGEDCMERQDGIDDRCPYPDDLIDLCVASQVDPQCSEGNPCPDGEICCLGANGCSTNCVPIECKTTAECPGNKICFQPQSRPNVCDCPFGFEGEDCMERQDGIDDRCPYPDDLIDLCVASQVDVQCSEGNPCSDGEICCLGANGCSTNCVPIECKTTAECPGNKICFQPQSRPNVCDCPFGFEGEDCMDRQDGIDDRCPYPDDLIDLCVASQVDPQCSEGNPCPDGEICCLGANGCSTNCVPIGCKDPVDRKTCTDQNKICIADDSTDGSNCRCPFGYSGTMCATPFAGFDEECPFPEVPGDTCDEYETTTCTKTDECEDDKVCCSTGCGTACVDLSDPKPPRKKPNLALIALLLSTRRQRPPVAPAVSIVSVAPIYPVSPILPVAPVRCPPNRCVCSKNLGAICEPSIRGCGANIRDQHTKKLITPLCKCNPGYQIYSPCSKDKCLDMYGRRLVCPGHPNARCRVTQCGRCQAYWMDIYTGKQVTCQRRQPVNPGGACGPWEMPILRCPDICRHTKCPNYPYATCTVRACNGCTARYTYQRRDVTAGCNQVVG
ncbi:uncharacterized protein LOC120347010 isoform X2 [Styela clava]